MRDAAEEQALQIAQTASAHDDQIRLLALRNGEDSISRIAILGNDRHLDIAEIRHAMLATVQNPLTQLIMNARVGCFALAQGLLEAQQRRSRSHVLRGPRRVVGQVLDLGHMAQRR